VFGNELASKGIRLLSIAPLLGGLRDLSTSILWVMGKKKAPFMGLIIGITCSFILNYYLVAIPGFSYPGTAIGMLCIDFVAVTYNLFVLFKTRSLVALFSILLETICFAAVIFLGFELINTVFTLDISAFLYNIVRIFCSNAMIFLYLFLRHLKTNRLNILLW
jgi:stage V sporulation protein B